MSYLRILPRCDAPQPCSCLACEDPGPSVSEVTLERAAVGQVVGRGEIAPQDPPDDWDADDYGDRDVLCRWCGAVLGGTRRGYHPDLTCSCEGAASARDEIRRGAR